MTETLQEDDDIIMDDPTRDTINLWTTLMQDTDNKIEKVVHEKKMEINLFQNNIPEKKTQKVGKRDTRRRIKAMLEASAFPNKYGRKVINGYVENPEFMSISIDKVDPKNIFVYEIDGEAWTSVQELEKRDFLKSIDDVEFDKEAFSAAKNLAVLNEHQDELEMCVEEEENERKANAKKNKKGAGRKKKFVIDEVEEFDEVEEVIIQAVEDHPFVEDIEDHVMKKKYNYKENDLLQEIEQEVEEVIIEPIEQQLAEDREDNVIKKIDSNKKNYLLDEMEQEIDDVVIEVNRESVELEEGEIIGKNQNNQNKEPFEEQKEKEKDGCEEEKSEEVSTQKKDKEPEIDLDREIKKHMEESIDKMDDDSSNKENEVQNEEINVKKPPEQTKKVRMTGYHGRIEYKSHRHDDYVVTFSYFHGKEPNPKQEPESPTSQEKPFSNPFSGAQPKPVHPNPSTSFNQFNRPNHKNNGGLQHNNNNQRNNNFNNGYRDAPPFMPQFPQNNYALPRNAFGVPMLPNPNESYNNGYNNNMNNNIRLPFVQPWGYPNHPNHAIQHKIEEKVQPTFAYSSMIYNENKPKVVYDIDESPKPPHKNNTNQYQIIDDDDDPILDIDEEQPTKKKVIIDLEDSPEPKCQPIVTPNREIYNKPTIHMSPISSNSYQTPPKLTAQSFVAAFTPLAQLVGSPPVNPHNGMPHRPINNISPFNGSPPVRFGPPPHNFSPQQGFYNQNYPPPHPYFSPQKCPNGRFIPEREPPNPFLPVLNPPFGRENFYQQPQVQQPSLLNRIKNFPMTSAGMQGNYKGIPPIFKNGPPNRIPPVPNNGNPTLLDIENDIDLLGKRSVDKEVQGEKVGGVDKAESEILDASEVEEGELLNTHETSPTIML